MSISTEIARIKSNIAAAYAKVSSKGGTLPAAQNSDNLAAAIDSIITGGGGGLPSGIAALDFGNVVVSSDIALTRETFNHNLGVTPDFVMVYATSNIKTTYSMLWSIRCPLLAYRSSTYDLYMCYHANSTTTVSLTNTNLPNNGVSNLTATTFQLSSNSSSYYWRAGTYKYIAIKFS